MAPMIPVPALMPKLTQVTHSSMAWVLTCPQTTVSNSENSLMHHTRFGCWQTAAQKADQPQRADVASRKIACVRGDRVKKEVRPASSCMDETDSQEVVRNPLVGTVPVFLRYGVRFSTALVPQLQLWSSTQSVGDLHFTLPFSGKQCCNRRNTSAFG